MDSFTLFVAIFSVVALAVQGCSCISSQERKSPIGFLDLGLAGLAIYMIVSVGTACHRGRFREPDGHL